MAAFGALGAIGGSIGAPIAAHFAQKRAFKYAKNILKNKHQWEVADLIAAGLNPILGYTKGGGGIIGPGSSPGVGGGGNLGTTALSAMKLRSELDLLQTSADRQRAESALALSRSGLAKEQAKKVELEVKEFKPTVGGLGRRLFNEFNTEKFIKNVGGIPDWILQRLRNAASRGP